MDKIIDQLVTVNFQKKNWEEIIKLFDSSNINKNIEFLEWGNSVKQKIQVSFEQKFTSGRIYVTLSKDDLEIIIKVIDSECNNRNKDWSDWASFIINQITTDIQETARKSSINDLTEKRKFVTRQIAKMSSDNIGDLISKNPNKQMILAANYYSKDKISIQMYLDPTVFNDNKSELFLFACYALRQFFNIGNNMVGEAFAGLFLRNEPTDEKLE